MRMSDQAAVLVWEECADRANGRTLTTIRVPADCALSNSDLIDFVVDAVFDRLGQIGVEVQVCEITIEDLAIPAAFNPRSLPLTPTPNP